MSTHLTLGVHVWTRRHLADELVSLAVARASRDEALRTSLPALCDATDPGLIGADIEIARAALMTALSDLDATDVAQALASRVRRAQRAAPISPVTQTLDAAQLSEHNGIRLRAHLAATLLPTIDGAVVRSRVPDLQIDAEELDAVAGLLAHGMAAVTDLGLPLARRLVLAGIAVRD